PSPHAYLASYSYASHSRGSGARSYDSHDAHRGPSTRQSKIFSPTSALAKCTHPHSTTHETYARRKAATSGHGSPTTHGPSAPQSSATTYPVTKSSTPARRSPQPQRASKWPHPTRPTTWLAIRTSTSAS